MATFKPVTSDIEPEEGDLIQINDGLKKSGPFDYVEGPAWVQIDMKEEMTIHAIALWHFYKNPAIYNDVIVAVSDDAAFNKNVRILFNNDHDNSSKHGKGPDSAYISRWWGEIVDARGENHAGTKARYVRVYTKDDMEGGLPRYVEIAVFAEK